ncbi:MAG: pilus assembly protein [Sulfuricaulis sp.]
MKTYMKSIEIRGGKSQMANLLALFKTLAARLLVSAALAGLAWAAQAANVQLPLSTIPLSLTSTTKPNVLVILDNSQSMDGHIPGIMTSGDDPATRSNVGRTILSKSIIGYRQNFNWGLETFATSGKTLYPIWNYYLGNTPTFDSSNVPKSGMTFTAAANCANHGVVDTDGNPITTTSYGLRCVANPQSFTGGEWVTYDVSANDANINDVFYATGFNSTIWGLSAGGTNYTLYSTHGSSPSSNHYWNTSNFSGGYGTYGFFATDAGYLASTSGTPPIYRELYIQTPPQPSSIRSLETAYPPPSTYGWGWDGSVTGLGTMLANVADVSTTNAATVASFNNLQSFIGYNSNNPCYTSGGGLPNANPCIFETASASSPEIKNEAEHTPLAGSLITADNYFTGSSSPVKYSCQQDFTVLVTDGIPTADKNGNPYSNTAAAQNDLWTQATTLKKASLPMANKNGVLTYVVGLGATDSNPTAITTLNTTASDGGTSHAYLPQDQNSFAQAISSILNDITSKTSAAAAVALNGGSLNTGSIVIQGKYNIDPYGNYIGLLLGYPINSDGTVGKTANWDAGYVLNSTQNFNTGRSIITYCNVPASCSASLTTPGGVPFRWPTSGAGIDSNEQAILDNDNGVPTPTYGQAVLNYLRGDSSNENAGLLFRPRPRAACLDNTNSCNSNGVLGDLVDSAPVFVQTPNWNYSDSLEPNQSMKYSQFVALWQNREPMIYVGSNDGMLHGFDGSTTGGGTEKIAYVPSMVYNNLQQLTLGPPQPHMFYVDGSPAVVDACLYPIGGSSCNWKSVLVGGLGAGGQGYFALDVTDPSKFSEANAKSLVLWEFSNATDSDLGFTYSKPSIVKMRNGRWAAIFGNGYNSGRNHAVLFIVFLDGYGATTPGKWVLNTDYIKIDTETGNATTSNGLASPAVVSAYNDGIADYIYAGDLLGHMWKFDVSSSNMTKWTVAFTSGSGYNSAQLPAASIAATPLFTATDGTASNNPQPITEQPQVGANPDEVGGNIVYFGTGQYLTQSDLSTTSIQTFYGIWDNGAAVASRVAGTGSGNNMSTCPTVTTPLLQQCFTSSQTTTTTDTPPQTVLIRTSTANPIQWAVNPPQPNRSFGWYIDLPTSGERQVSNPVLREGSIIFTTMIPASAPCTYGGSSSTTVLAADSGSRLTSQSPFPDIGTVTVNGQKVYVSSILNPNVIVSQPTILNSGTTNGSGKSGSSGCVDNKYENANDGSVPMITDSCSGNRLRQSWGQIY